MRNKIIIHNYTDLNDLEIFNYIYRVMLKGKVSETKQGKQYCFVTHTEGLIIFCNRRKNTYTFKVFFGGKDEEVS